METKVAVINIVVYISTLVMYYKGKKYRIGVQEKDLFGRLGLA